MQMNESPNPDSPTTPVNNNKKQVVTLSIAVAVLVIIVLAWSLMNAKNIPQETPNDSAQTQSSQVEQNADTSQNAGSVTEGTADTRITASETLFTVEEFLKKNNSLTSSQVEFIKKITGFANPVTDGSDEHSTVITSLTDAKDPNVIYVAYSSWNPSVDEFYRMDSKTDKTETILRSDSQAYALELYGQQGRKLLFLKKDRGDSPGPCSNMWTYAYENPLPRPADEIGDSIPDYRTFQALDLDNVQAGLKYFPVPKEKYEIEKKVVEQCSVEFDKHLDEEAAAQPK